MFIKKHRRGYYEMFGEMLVENPVETREGEITELHTRRLEKDIIAHPESWLWSHRRWKHKRVVAV
jgi:KDO2-lipid IV(A) lauroyltransferase